MKKQQRQQSAGSQQPWQSVSCVICGKTKVSMESPQTLCGFWWDDCKPAGWMMSPLGTHCPECRKQAKVATEADKARRVPPSELSKPTKPYRGASGQKQFAGCKL
jgi:hypothetical protein